MEGNVKFMTAMRNLRQKIAAVESTDSTSEFQTEKPPRVAAEIDAEFPPRAAAAAAAAAILKSGPD